MPAITATNMSAGTGGSITITEVTLDGTTDSFTYAGGANDTLIFVNDSGGALTPVIVGSTAGTVAVSGVPAGVDTSGGYSMGSIANGAVAAVKLKSISQYLSGTLTITGASGITAQYLTY